VITWHRSITHSLVLLPLWALLLGASRAHSRTTKVGSAIVRGADRNLCRWHPQPHPARPGHVVWHDDLVTLEVVPPGVGFYFYRGFTLTAILLVPQLLAWLFAPEKVNRVPRNVAVFLPAPWLIAKMDRLLARRFRAEWF